MRPTAARGPRSGAAAGRCSFPRVLPRTPYLLPPSGALTAFTIDLISRPATVAAEAAIAERSRGCVRLMAASRGDGVPDVYADGSIGSTAYQVQGCRACDTGWRRRRCSP